MLCGIIKPSKERKMKIIKYLFIIYILFPLLVNAQQPEQLKYRRSSIYSLLINHTEQKFGKEIGDVFLSMPVPDKYNDHNLSVRVVSTTANVREKEVGRSFIENNGIASRLVAHWFNRNILTGECNTDLIKERGLYNASEFDKELADRSARGKALLEDAGEELISCTFVLVNDIRYVDKSNTGRGVGQIMRFAGSLAAAYTGVSSLNNLGDLAGSLSETLKGFRVNIDTHLYQLVWDEETAMNFYTNYYTAISDPEKRNAFEQNRNKFKLKYVGSQHSDGSMTSFMGVNLDNPKQMIRKACQRALDENVMMLQRNFESFKIKTPLISTAPLCAEIGLKEGITSDSKFEVLEAVADKDGHITYKRVGVIKPVSNLIWDNRYMAQEEGAYGADFRYTTFKKVSGSDFYPGMLIREIK